MLSITYQNVILLTILTGIMFIFSLLLTISSIKSNDENAKIYKIFGIIVLALSLICAPFCVIGLVGTNDTITSISETKCNISDIFECETDNVGNTYYICSMSTGGHMLNNVRLYTDTNTLTVTHIVNKTVYNFPLGEIVVSNKDYYKIEVN